MAVSWFGPFPAELRNLKGKGQFWELSRPLAIFAAAVAAVLQIGFVFCICVCCKKHHSIVNNVVHQKGSFSMPGKRK